MQAKDVIRQVVEGSHMITGMYVADLNDADLLVRAVPGSNHIAWQLGHMIAGTAKMLGWLGHAAPELPEGFAEAYGRENAACDDPARFATKAQYMALAEKMKTATLAAIDATPAEELDRPGPKEMRDYAPTVASALTLLGSHWLMHAGQFVPIRRKLGKGPMF
jgi:hypothetical protein